MTKPTFTPGPWQAWQERAPNGSWFVEMPDGGQLEIGFLPNGKPDEADARLIAAAPEMYAALQSALDEAERQDNNPEDPTEFDDTIIKKMRGALAKATGE